MARITAPIKRKEISGNPMRPVYDTDKKRRYTACRITELKGRPMLAFMPDLTIRVDADNEPLFVKELLEVIPSSEISRDRDIDVYYVAPKHLDFLKGLCYDYFDKVVFESETGIVKNLKG